MTIKHILLAGAALCAVSANSAYARSKPELAVVALHPGHAVVKSVMHHDTQKLTSSASAFTSIPKSDYKKKTMLLATYYAYYDSGSFCGTGNGKTKVVLPSKKTKYAKLSTGTESYSEGCSSPTLFYGDVYDLTSKKAKSDSFLSKLENKKVHFDGAVYDATLNLTVDVTID